MVRKAALATALLVAACDKAPTAPPVAPVIADPNAKILQLEKRLTELEMETTGGQIILRPNGGGWVMLRTENGMDLRFGLNEVVASGNGSKALIDIGNPAAVSLRDCLGTVGWGEVNPDQTTKRETWHTLEVRLPDVLPAGDFAQLGVPLADIPPEKLGMIIVSDVRCRRWQQK